MRRIVASARALGTVSNRTGLRPVSRVLVRIALAALLAGGAGALVPAGGRALEPIVYTMRFPAPDSHTAVIEARVPTEGRASIDLMLPVWSPGYYRTADYAASVRDFRAATPAGASLTVEKPKPNHWVVVTDRAPAVVISYSLDCQSQFVTGCWVGLAYGVINGPSTYITLAERAARPHEIQLELPSGWKESISSLDPAPNRQPNHYRAPDYDVFVDSPIVAGTISTHAFTVGKTAHILADFGELGAWDGQAAAALLKRIAEQHRRLLGELPFARYVFLNAFRRGAGGLEHLNSSLLTSAPNSSERLPTLRWLKFASHEYFHAINVKRLRPIELGPFDYERLPETPSLWISEGLTTYYGDLAVARSGVGTQDDFLAGLSGHIRTVQTSPGRLVQTLAQASLAVGESSRSGVGGNRDTTISYYAKGPAVGFLLDARIRRLTADAKSLDDVMRLAYQRYSGARGFTPEEFQKTASEVAGADLRPFFHAALETTGELDYQEALDWFGLRFAEATEPGTEWRLEVRPEASTAQRQHLRHLVGSAPGSSK
jgi:predicted metalloprotease with PDZ domain